MVLRSASVRFREAVSTSAKGAAKCLGEARLPRWYVLSGPWFGGASGDGAHVVNVQLGPCQEGSLPEFMHFKLFGKTVLVVNRKVRLFWAIHSASEKECLMQAPR